MRYSVFLAMVALLALGSRTELRADVFQLVDGGTVQGTLLKRGERGEYVIKTREGAELVLADKQVANHQSQSEYQADYEARSRVLPDTVAAHRAMVSWCKAHHLSDLVDHHLHKILELDPNDEKARASLGYQRLMGKWMTREEFMADRGMLFFDGAYRTAQDIALRKRELALEAASQDWYRQLKLWRSWLNSRRSGRADEALQNLRAVTDPDAATSVVRMLGLERDEDLRELWMELLSQIDHSAAVAKLVSLSIEEPDRQTRMQCIDYLLAGRREIDIGSYVRALSNRRSDNETINIAAEALGEIGNPEAISPLIDALVTKHRVPNPNAQPGNMSASFSPDGSGGAGMTQGSGPKFIIQEFNNVEVRRALVKLSGQQDHGFNQQAWSRWYVNQRSQARFVDPRRDE